VFIESLILVFENWRLKTYLKRDQSIKLRNYGRHLSKAVFLVSKYPNNITDLATAFFKSQTNSFSKYILNSTYNVCYYYNTDFSSVKTQIDASTLQFDDQTRQYDDATRQFGDVTRQYDDATLQFDDQTRQYDDATRQYDDATRQYDDATRQFGDVTRQFGDVTRQFDDATRQFDRLVCFTSITNWGV